MTAEARSEEGMTEARRRVRRRSRAGDAADPAAETVARIRSIVAAIKADREAAGLSPLPVVEAEPGEHEDFSEAGGRDELVMLLKQYLAAREHEHAGWEAERQQFRTALAAMEEQARKAVLEREEAADRHRQAMAELTLQHEHQRSVWLLERRRLEITLRSFELRQQRRRWSKAKLPRLRPAVAAGLVILALAIAGLTRDSGALLGLGAAQDYLGTAPIVLKLLRGAEAG